MTALADNTGAGAWRVDTYGVGWSTIAACALVAESVGDHRYALDLVDQLVTDTQHHGGLRGALFLWCDMAIQAAQVMDDGVHLVPLDGLDGDGDAGVHRWAVQLLNARAAGDHDELHRLSLRVVSIEAMTARLLAVLDLAASVVARAREPHP